MKQVEGEMKVLLVNGSPHREGSTYRALSVVEGGLQEAGVQTDWFSIENKPVYGCTDCQCCSKIHRCAFGDDRCNELIDKMLEADGVIIASPVYFAGINGALKALLDRAFYAAGTFGQMYKNKPAAALVCRYRSGGATALEALNKYFVTSQMPVVGSIDYTEFNSDFDPEKNRFDTKVLKKLAENMAAMLCHEA